METEKSSEVRPAAENTDVQAATETVELIEMGDVSVETKGFVRGLEIGLTPKN
jgi:hypothetical protein